MLDSVAAARVSRRRARQLGFSAAGPRYAAMIALTGESERSLERQLVRARRRIRRARGEERSSQRIGPSPGLRVA